MTEPGNVPTQARTSYSPSSPLRAVTIPENLSALSQGKTQISKIVLRPGCARRAARGEIVEGQRYFERTKGGNDAVPDPVPDAKRTPAALDPTGPPRDPPGTSFLCFSCHARSPPPRKNNHLRALRALTAVRASLIRVYLCVSVVPPSYPRPSACICGSILFFVPLRAPSWIYETNPTPPLCPPCPLWRSKLRNEPIPLRVPLRAFAPSWSPFLLTRHDETKPTPWLHLLSSIPSSPCVRVSVVRSSSSCKLRNEPTAPTESSTSPPAPASSSSSRCRRPSSSPSARRSPGGPAP